jgi:hypothetical protein
MVGSLVFSGTCTKVTARIAETVACKVGKTKQHIELDIARWLGENGRFILLTGESTA